MTQPELILASQSPRRKSLLTQLGYSFSCQPANIDETVKPSESAIAYVERLALAKAQAVLEQVGTDSKTVVIGSDTAVVFKEHILGKPRDFADFEQMMQMLSGQCHQVLTSVAVVSDKRALVDVVATDVWFKQLSSNEIADYWQTGEPCDKAGGYGIQGIGGKFVIKIHGSYFAVVGLPLFETAQLLNQFDLSAAT